MKKSKHSPKKLPPNQTGLYSILDPHQYIESGLINWYENLEYIPSQFLWEGIFTDEECFDFSEQVQKYWIDFEEQASLGFRQLYPYFEDYQKNQHKFNSFNDKNYLLQISYRVASYKSLMSIKPLMKKVIFKRDKLTIFKEIYGDIYITPGQPKEELMYILIQDIENLSKKYFPDSRKYKPYRSVLAFYLAKQDIFDDLKCEHKKVLSCSRTDCMTIRQQNCKDTIKYYMKKVKLDPDRSDTVLLCKKDFTYGNCKKCIDSFVDQTAFDRPILFLRTPCRLAIERYNDIFERIEKDRYSGRVKFMHIKDIEMFRNELQSARHNNDRKKITAIYDKTIKLYPQLTRKKIQRILSQ